MMLLYECLQIQWTTCLKCGKNRYFDILHVRNLMFKLFVYLTKKCNLFTSVLPDWIDAQATCSTKPKKDVLVSIKIKLDN